MNEAQLGVDLFCARQEFFNYVYKKFHLNLLFSVLNRKIIISFFFSQSECESLRKGYLVLWLNQAPATSFLGQIGDFIDVDADINVLRITLPILTDYFPTFLFDLEVNAKEFVSKVTPFLKGNEKISAFGIDELKDRVNRNFVSLTSVYFIKNLPKIEQQYDK